MFFPFTLTWEVSGTGGFMVVSRGGEQMKDIGTKCLCPFQSRQGLSLADWFFTLCVCVYTFTILNLLIQARPGWCQWFYPCRSRTSAVPYLYFQFLGWCCSSFAFPELHVFWKSRSHLKTLDFSGVFLLSMHLFLLQVQEECLCTEKKKKTWERLVTAKQNYFISCCRK